MGPLANMRRLCRLIRAGGAPPGAGVLRMWPSGPHATKRHSRAAGRPREGSAAAAAQLPAGRLLCCCQKRQPKGPPTLRQERCSWPQWEGPVWPHSQRQYGRWGHARWAWSQELKTPGHGPAGPCPEIFFKIFFWKSFRRRMACPAAARHAAHTAVRAAVLAVV